MAAVGHGADRRLGHEARDDAELAGDLGADLAIGHEAVAGALAGVELEVQLELRGVLVVALDHVQAERLGVRDHALDDRAHRLQGAHVVGRRDVRLRPDLDLGAQPAHLRLRPGAQLQPGALAERGVGPRQRGADAGRQRLPSALPAIRAGVEVADDARERPVPGQDGEGRSVGQGDELLRLRPARDERAVAARGQIGDRGAVELDAPLQVAAQVPRRHDLGHHAGVQGRELVVDVLDPGFLYLSSQIVRGSGVSLELLRDSRRTH